jgi:hypothetical protein
MFSVLIRPIGTTQFADTHIDRSGTGRPVAIVLRDLVRHIRRSLAHYHIWLFPG